jgi:hypothetical protein
MIAWSLQIIGMKLCSLSLFRRERDRSLGHRRLAEPLPVMA